MNQPTPTCYWCGEEEVLDILEVWNDREFSLGTCCDRLYHEVIEDLNESDGGTVRDEIADLLRGYGIACRKVFSSDSRGQIVIDSGLRLASITGTIHRPQATAGVTPSTMVGPWSRLRLSDGPWRG